MDTVEGTVQNPERPYANKSYDVGSVFVRYFGPDKDTLKANVLNFVSASVRGVSLIEIEQRFIRSTRFDARLEQIASQSFDDAINLVYATVLGRQADQIGLSVYTNQLRSGRDVMNIKREIANSHEAREKILTDVYRQLLLRDPDSEGTRVYSEQLISGRSVDDIASEIRKSDEYKNISENRSQLVIFGVSPIEYLREQSVDTIFSDSDMQEGRLEEKEIKELRFEIDQLRGTIRGYDDLYQNEREKKLKADYKIVQAEEKIVQLEYRAQQAEIRAETELGNARRLQASYDSLFSRASKLAEQVADKTVRVQDLETEVRRLQEVAKRVGDSAAYESQIRLLRSQVVSLQYTLRRYGVSRDKVDYLELLLASFGMSIADLDRMPEDRRSDVVGSLRRAANKVLHSDLTGEQDIEVLKKLNSGLDRWNKPKRPIS